MINEVKDISLYFITSSDEEQKILNEIYTALDRVVKPGEFLEKIPDYRDAITKIDSRISVAKTRIQHLVSAYHTRLDQVKAMLSQYQSQIEKRILDPNQLNTNVTFYDEENQLSKSEYSGYEEEASEYSMLAIVKRILNDEPENIEYLEKFLQEIDSVYKWYINAQSHMLRAKLMLNDNEFISLFTSEFMSSEGEEKIRELKRFINSTQINLSQSKDRITKLFQMFNAQESDYEIYARVVERFNSVALESYFSTGFVSGGIF